MAKAKGIDWEIANKENRNLNERLDKLFDKKGPDDCWNYVRQRKRKPKMTHRGRISFMYNGKRYQTYAYRLVYTRHRGRIADNLDVAHLCDSNGNCGNPSHLVTGSRKAHREFDSSQRKWREEIKARCPTAKGHYGTISRGWTTNRKHKRGARKKRAQKRMFVKVAAD